MELEKRKRENNGVSNGKRAKPQEDDNGIKQIVPTTPKDDEVEEFYAILKRIHVAVKYFQERNGGRFTDRDITARTWSPSFQPEDFEGAKRSDPESAEENRNAGLDLNSEPVSDVSDDYA